jgi:hypothetical protein
VNSILNMVEGALSTNIHGESGGEQRSVGELRSEAMAARFSNTDVLSYVILD